MKTNIFDIDFQRGTFKSRETVELVQYDNKTNLFIFNINNELPIGSSLLLKIKHYEGNEFEYPLVITNNKAQVLITNNITYIPGEIKISVSLIGTDNRILTAVEMLENIPIIEAIQGEMPPEEEVNALIQLIADNNQLKQEMQELIDDHIAKLEAGYYKGESVELAIITEYLCYRYPNEEWIQIVHIDKLKGKPAYDYAVSGGFTGTEEEFCTSLASIGYVNKVLDEINGEVV